MAKIEVDKYLASSKDNFLVFANDSYQKPMVTFYFRNSTFEGTGQILIKDALNEDGFNKVIKYSPNEIISDSTFKYTAGDRTANLFSLVECLRKNTIFYDFTFETNGSGVMIAKAYIDSSTRYSITADSDIVIGGSFSSYVPKEPNKFVLMLNDSENQILLEKYTTGNEVSFNVTAPYEHLSFKSPKQVRMVGYHIDNNNVITDNISNNSVIVFPTTLPKFSDENLSDYCYSYTGQRVNFLTHNFNRYYNYGEMCGLSVLSDKMIGLVKKYYTVAGKYLEMDTTFEYRESFVMRQDLYFNIDVSGVEARTNREVGYVDVYGTYNGVEMTNPVRYKIIPKCNQNNEIFFINELGGIDSFNFLGEREYKTKISKQVTYFKNPTKKYGTTKELEIVAQKVNNVEHNLKSAIIDSDTATWLNEMSKSKYPFLFTEGGNSKFERIVITDMDISVSDRDNTFEVELTYKTGDNNITI